MRSNCDLFIYLDVTKILAGNLIKFQDFIDDYVADFYFPDSIPLFTSTNNVVLTSGIEGALPPTYFKKVVRKSGEVLLES